MTTFLIVRHGQTAWNKDERFRGRTDLPLNETGWAQAKAVATYIAATYRPTAVYASPLLRALETAQPIAEMAGLSVQPDDGLLDIHYGDFTGLSPAEAEERFPALYRAWSAAPHTVHFPNGEELADVKRRVMGLVGRLVTANPEEQIVLVTHLVVCRVLICSLLGLDLDQFQMFQVDTSSLSVFERYNGQTRLVMVNRASCGLPGGRELEEQPSVQTKKG